MSVNLKIGRKEYAFTKDDVFLDNGSCVQCLSQEGNRSGFLGSAPLKLTQKAIKHLDTNYERVNIPEHNYSKIEGLSVFYYNIEEV